MIKASELRIGNWVNYNGYYRQIVSLNLDTDVNAEPIPLSDDILLKCGFLKDTDWLEQVKFWKSGVCLIYSGENRYIYRPEHDGGTLIFEALHKLQNFMYALKEVELEFNI